MVRDAGCGVHVPDKGGLLVMNRSNMAPSRVLFSFICCMLWSASVCRKSLLAALFAAPSSTVHELHSMSLAPVNVTIFQWVYGILTHRLILTKFSIWGAAKRQKNNVVRRWIYNWWAEHIKAVELLLSVLSKLTWSRNIASHIGDTLLVR